jgi:hypothetical protein
MQFLASVKVTSARKRFRFDASDAISSAVTTGTGS